MDYFKRLAASLCFLQILFTQAKGSCTINPLGFFVNCDDENMTDLSSELGKVTEWTDSVVSLYVEHTGLQEIYENTTTRTIIVLTIWYNKSLTTIDPMAFPSSNSSVERLVIKDCPNLNDNVWGVVSKMSAMKYLTLDNAGLTVVPDKVFEERKSLKEICLSNNGITTFKAPLGELSLQKLDLQHNRLTNDSFLEGVFEGKGHLTELVLLDNQSMTQLEEKQFEGLLAKGTKVWVGRSQSADHKYMDCTGAKWLCAEKEGGAYFHETVFGYECVEPEFDTIVDYCKSL